MSDPTVPPIDPQTLPPGATPADPPPRSSEEAYEEALDDAHDALTANRYRALGRFLSTAWETFGPKVLDRLSDIMDAMNEVDLDRRASAAVAEEDNASDGDGDGDDKLENLQRFRREPDGTISTATLRFDPRSGEFVNPDGSPADVPEEVSAVLVALHSAFAGAVGGAPTPPAAEPASPEPASPEPAPTESASDA